MATKIKALQLWCRKMTDGYRDVDVRDFTASWRDGLAFCALIHRFRPDLIDYDTLSKENVFENNQLAFSVAESQLEITAFLEAADMAEFRTPDKLSVITYVSQYYNKLNSLPQLGGPGVQAKTSTPAAGTKRLHTAEPLSEPEPKKQPQARQPVGSSDSQTKGKSLGDRCAICKEKVYLLERHIEEGKLYHRACYRHSDLSPTGKVYTRSPFLSPSLHGKEPDVSSPSKQKAALDKKKTAAVLDSNKDLKNHVSSGANKLHTDKRAVSKPQTSSAAIAMFDAAVKGGPASSSKPLQSDSRLIQNHSIDYLSAEPVVKDVKSPKRQLPLILQAAAESTRNTSSAAKDVEKRCAGKPVLAKTFSGNNAESCGNSSKTSVSTEKSKQVAPGGAPSIEISRAKLTVKSSSSTHSQSETTSAAPVAKPRRAGKKEYDGKMASSDPAKKRDRSPVRPVIAAVPKPSPRTSIPSQETSKTSTPSKKFTPAPRKLPPRPESPIRDRSPSPSSPPPLPPSAPPSVPSQAAPPLPSSAPPRHPLPSSPSPSPRHLPSDPSHPHPASASQDSTTGDNRPTAPASLTSSQHSSNHISSIGQLPSASISKVTSAMSSSRKDSLTAFSQPPPQPSAIKSNVSQSKSDFAGPKQFPFSALSSSLSTSSNGNGFSTKHTRSVTNRSNGRYGEEPMDVEDKEREQYREEEPLAVLVVPRDKKRHEQSVLSGLLSSLANIRKSNPPSASPLPSASNLPPSQALTANTDLVVPDNSGTLQVLQNKDENCKVVGLKGLNGISESSCLASEHVGKSSHPASVVASSSSPDSENKMSSQSLENGSEKCADMKTPSKGSIVLLNTEKEVGKESDKPKTADLGDKMTTGSFEINFGKSGVMTPSSETQTFESNTRKETLVLSDFDLKPKDPSRGYVPLYKKKQAGFRPKGHGQGVTLSTPKDLADDDVMKRRTADPEEKRERPKSAAEVGTGKAQLLSHQPDKATDAEQLPPFTQVKLRQSGQTPSERKEKSKSAGFISLDTASGSRPQWQLEAERRMAAVQTHGFVDPEIKKTSSESDKAVEYESLKEPDDKTELPCEFNQSQNCKFENMQGEQVESQTKSNVTRENIWETVDECVKNPSSDHTPLISEPTRLNSAVVDSTMTAVDQTSLKPKGILKNKVVETTPPPPKPERTLLNNVKKEEIEDQPASVCEDKVAETTPPPPIPERTLRNKVKKEEIENQPASVCEDKVAETTPPPPIPERTLRNKVKKEEIEDQPASVCEDEVAETTPPLPIPERTLLNKNKKEEVEDKVPSVCEDKVTETTPPPPIPERTLRNKVKKELEEQPASVCEDTSKPELSEPCVSEEAEVTLQKKKVAIGSLKEDLMKSLDLSPPSTPTPSIQKSPPPPRPSKPPGAGRKKISVDIQFDFDLSNSVEVAAAVTENPVEVEMIPTPGPPAPRKTSMSPGRLSAIELQQQLLDIDCKLSDLELRGRYLEDSIRNVAAEEEDDLMKEWFQLVTEKNDLVRKECDLVYLSREQDLEDEQSRIESQLHYLLSKDVSEKSFEEREEEEYLIFRKLEIVDQRNSIVESMDEDRLRYEEEDRDIAQMLQDKGYKKDSASHVDKGAGKPLQHEHTVGSSKFYA